LKSLSNGIRHLTQGMELSDQIKSLEDCRNVLENKIENLQEQIDQLDLQSSARNNNPAYTLRLDHQKVRKEAEMLKLEEDLTTVKDDIDYLKLRQKSRLGLNDVPSGTTASHTQHIPTSVSFHSPQ